ncbi:hypothetical protein [Inhella gelatinilytica]|uniref:Uncharacterized protein n=1 Tax=Inhella gelatinilytica TaxID=2795030 RepID=A0A931IUT7_9BURK|nr:hypothetical protein [Inhella gelatinilytica]MBH9553177.1 hypothetical protein [Inhella gelatinilytica]
MHVLMLGVAVLFLAWCMHLPLTLLPDAALDDALFWQLGAKLVGGSWLGRYDELTLAKGPTFSLFLAMNHGLGLPLSLSLGLVHLGTVWLLGRELRHWGLSARWTLLAMGLLLIQPAALPIRVVRDALYHDLTLLVLVGLMHLLRPGARRATAWAYGAVFAAFWATREEGVWMLPGVAAVLSLAVWRRRVDWLSALRPWLQAGGACALVLALVCSANWLRYGIWAVVDFKRAPFVETLGLLGGIEAGPVVDYVPVTRLQREAAYAVSPAFAELRGVLEDGGADWKAWGCGLYPDTCGDYAGGWFMWALRSAAAARGHFQSGVQADAFFARVATELRDACESGQLKCRQLAVPFLPQMSYRAWAAFPGAIQRAWGMALYQERVPLTDGPSRGSPEAVAAFARFTGLARYMPLSQDDVWRIQGWLVSPRGDWPELLCGEGSRTQVIPIERLPSPDLVTALQNPKASDNRFRVQVADGAQCQIRLIGQPDVAMPLTALRKGFQAPLPDGGRVAIDRVSHGVGDGAALRLKYALGELYRHAALPFMAFAGLWILLATGLRRAWRQPAPPLLAWGLLCWALAGVRTVLLALVDVSAFPGVNILYLLPCTHLWVLGGVLLMAAAQLIYDSTHHPDALPQ